MLNIYLSLHHLQTWQWAGTSARRRLDVLSEYASFTRRALFQTQTEICQRSERSPSSRFLSAANLRLRVSAEPPLMASLWRLQADHQEHNLPPCWAAASFWINHPSQLEVKLFDFMCDPNKTASPEWRCKWCSDGEKRVCLNGSARHRWPFSRIFVGFSFAQCNILFTLYLPSNYLYSYFTGISC